MKLKHPYNDFEGSQLWILIDRAINDLIENQDIELTTRKEYVIGYICKILSTPNSQIAKGGPEGRPQ